MDGRGLAVCWLGWVEECPRHTRTNGGSTNVVVGPGGGLLGWGVGASAVSF